jgi:hypothetical protein
VTVGAGEWPVELDGVTETLVTTLGPNDRWNVAALGVHAPGREAGELPTARTWGRTRTWRNFKHDGEGYVQFVRDPELFVEAALAVSERDEPVLEGAYAWGRADVEAAGEGTSEGTKWVRWDLHAANASVERRTVPTFNRGYAAVIEATVAASRLDVESYDSDRLRERIGYFEEVTERAGGSREQAAFERLRELIE